MFFWCFQSPLALILFMPPILWVSVSSEMKDLIEISQLGLSVPNTPLSAKWVSVCSHLLKEKDSLIMAEQGTEYNRVSLGVS